MDAITQWLSKFRMSDLYMPNIRIIDMLDILIVAFIVYQLMVWIKETRAWSLFKGIIVIMLFCFVAMMFELTTMLFILSNALNVGIIAVIVVFQPELRKALEQLGKGNFISSFIAVDVSDEEKFSDNTLESILTACTKMSKEKTGALILIEQDVPLGDLVSTGIAVDAVVTSQLLINIFEHNTPLHDGAVIIKNNRIAAATCFLPLTESKMSMDLGTRHRAAVGASEVSDAFVIVVSEETGHISVARSGKLNRNLTVDKIRVMYNENLKKSKKKLVIGRGRRREKSK